MMMAGCAAPTSMDSDSRMVGTTPAEVIYKRQTIAECCSIAIPAGASVANAGRPLDSMEAAVFSYGGSTISYDLTMRLGLSALERRTWYWDQRLEDVDGFVSSTSIPVRRDAKDAVLFSVTVICPERGCELARKVLRSVEVAGKPLNEGA